MIIKGGVGGSRSPLIVYRTTTVCTGTVCLLFLSLQFIFGLDSGCYDSRLGSSNVAMALLLETTLGDVVVDLDIEGSPEICKNVLKLAKARYFTSTLVFNVQPNRFCQLGDPQGDGSGGACIYGLISTLLASEDGKLHNQKVLQSQQRFLKSNMGRPLTREECQEKGRIVATEMKGVADTIGSQLLITISEGQDMALDGFNTSAGSTTIGNGEDRQLFRSVGVVREDENNVLDQIAATYCDADGRPYADIRVIRALIIDDPFDDPPGMDQLLRERGVEINEQDDRVIGSPEYERPPEEKVEIRIQADQVDPLTGEDDLEKMREQEEEIQKREDKSRAVVLEMVSIVIGILFTAFTRERVSPSRLRTVHPFVP